MKTEHDYVSGCPLCDEGYHDYSDKEKCICCSIDFSTLPKVEFSRNIEKLSDKIEKLENG